MATNRIKQRLVSIVVLLAIVAGLCAPAAMAAEPVHVSVWDLYIDSSGNKTDSKGSLDVAAGTTVGELTNWRGNVYMFVIKAGGGAIAYHDFYGQWVEELQSKGYTDVETFDDLAKYGHLDAYRRDVDEVWKKALHTYGTPVDPSDPVEHKALYLPDVIVDTTPSAEAPYADEYVYETYRANNPDLVAAFGDDRPAYLAHWLQFGKAEGRIAK